MKKLITILLFCSFFAIVQAKEQKVIFISVNAGNNLSGGLNPKQASESIDGLLKKGWRITMVSGSGADSIVRIFCLVLERD